MMHPTLPLVFLSLGLIACWAWLLFKRPVQVPRVSVVLSVLSVPLMITLVLVCSKARFGNVLVALEGFRVHLDQMREPTFYIGGSQHDDHFVVSRLPPQFLQISLEEDELVVAIAPPGRGDEGIHTGFGVVRYHGPGAGDGPFHNAFSLKPNSVISMGEGQSHLVFRESPRRFESASTVEGEASETSSEGTGQGLLLPSRTTPFLGLDLPVLRYRGASSQMFPLRYYGSGKAGGERTGPRRVPIGSFMCQAGGQFNRDPYLVLLDPFVALGEGESAQTYQPTVARLRSGQGGRFHLYRIGYQPLDSNGRGKFSRVQERRSFNLEFQSGVADITLHTPSYLSLSQENIAKLQRRLSEEKPVTLALAMQGFSQQLDQDKMVLDFGILGQPLSHEIFSSIQLPETSDTLMVTSHGGTRAHRFGDGFLLGENASVKLRVSKQTLPVGLLLLVWATSLACLGAAFSVRTDALSLMLLSGLEYFLGLRLLIALQAAGLDTKLLTAPLNALIALLVVPFVVQTGFALYRAGYQAWLKVVGHPRTVLYWLLVVVALGGIYWMTPFSFKRFALPAGFVSVAPFGMAAGGLVLDRCFSWFLHHPRRTLLLCLFAAAPVAFRFVTLLAFGWQERMSGLGSGVAVSVYYTPWALLVFAGLWHFREKIGASWVIYVIMVVVILVATPILARDYGAGLIFSIPVFLLFALPLVQYPKKLVSWLYASPFLGTLCLHLGMLLIPVLGFTNQGPGGRGDAMARAKQDKAFAEAVLEQRLLISDYNKLRVLGQLSPDKLNQIGTVKSERLGLVFANLQIYGARGALGTGFLNTERAPSLGAHVSDYVSSVHVLAPFGWLGSLAVLGLAVGLGFGPLIQFRKAGLGTFDSMRKAFGLVTVWTLACAALYMFSANIGLVMFTGKNVYLLAVDSNSDLLEGTLLFGLALWAFHDTGKGTV